jgi:VanZ family protein
MSAAPRDPQLRKAIRGLFWIACVAVCVLALLPASQLPMGLLDWWDKAQHALAFATLASLGGWAYPRFAARVTVGLLFLGGVIEIAQAMTTWRHGDVFDWLADSVGVLAVMGFWIWRRR